MAAQESCILITHVHWFFSFPLVLPVGFSGILALNDVLSKCVPPVSRVLLSIGPCLVNLPVWLPRWSRLGAVSPRLHLLAPEHVTRCGFAVPLRVDAGLAFTCLCCSVVALVLTVKNTCDISNPVQVPFHFHRVSVCVYLILLLPWQFRDKCACGQECW